MDEDADSSERFNVSIGLHETFIVASATGELDYSSAHLLRQQVKDAWQATDSAGLVLDLGGVTFCDSIGVGVLVLLLRQSREQHSNLVLSNLPPLLERILTITGLRTAFLVEESVDEAIRTVQEAPQSTPPEDAEPSS
ncbi:STAS domain-containing protein [Nonomuraea sp. NPDC050404]|uniref:STAS domain-containing protein n=1 Tax=Nonomuraea sp. NPDC050404 TaxID=3155783 RepID=UPI0033F0ADAD